MVGRSRTSRFDYLVVGGRTALIAWSLACACSSFVVFYLVVDGGIFALLLCWGWCLCCVGCFSVARLNFSLGYEELTPEHVLPLFPGPNQVVSLYIFTLLPSAMPSRLPTLHACRVSSYLPPAFPLYPISDLIRHDPTRYFVLGPSRYFPRFFCDDRSTMGTPSTTSRCSSS